jgi:hypothetical protein
MSEKPTEPESAGPTIRRRGPQAFAQDAGVLLKHHLAAHGFGDVDLVTRWAAIAGESLAQRCLPQRLSGKGEEGATLTLLADDRAALELQHQTPQLIDKINTYFGRSVVKKIKIMVGDIPRPVVPPPPAPPLTAAEEATLAEATDAIADPDLRSAFTRLGREALARSRRRNVR